MGETCGMKLVYETKNIDGKCSQCENIDRKKRRLDKLLADLELSKDDISRKASHERAKADADTLRSEIEHLMTERFARRVSAAGLRASADPGSGVQADGGVGNDVQNCSGSASTHMVATEECKSREAVQPSPTETAFVTSPGHGDPSLINGSEGLTSAPESLYLLLKELSQRLDSLERMLEENSEAVDQGHGLRETLREVWRALVQSGSKEAMPGSVYWDMMEQYAPDVLQSMSETQPRSAHNRLEVDGMTAGKADGVRDELLASDGESSSFDLCDD